MNKEDIIMNAVFLGVVIASFALSFHIANKGIEIDTTPLYWPETFPPDPEPDWEMDEAHIDHLKELGLWDEEDDGEEYVTNR